jgi:hypothetical protein
MQMPYINWDEYGKYSALAKVYDRFSNGKAQQPPVAATSKRQMTEVALEQYLTPQSGRSLHPRRTLDQFYYSSLIDTSIRDQDQTTSKWTGSGVGTEGHTSASDDSLVMMVDQLWCWVLDESKSSHTITGRAIGLIFAVETIVSCFPSHDLQYHGGKQYDLGDLYEGSESYVERCETVWDLFATITDQAITHLWSQRNRTSIDPLEIYRWITAKKVNALDLRLGSTDKG